MDPIGYILINLVAQFGAMGVSPVSLACPAGQMAVLKPAPETRMKLINHRWQLTEDAYECVEVDADGNAPGTGGIPGSRGHR